MGYDCLRSTEDSRLFPAAKDPDGGPPRRTQYTLTKSKVKSGPIISTSEPQTRKKANKYASFSKAAQKKTLESVEEVMSESKEQE